MHLNLFSLPPTPQGEELCQELWSFDGGKIERIVSFGQISPPDFWYHQGEDEWVTVLQGEGTVAYRDGTQDCLKAGDTLLLPAGKDHRVSYTSAEPPCIWLCVFGKGR